MTFERLRSTEVWVARVRLAAVPFALFQIAVFRDHYPHGYDVVAWTTTGVFCVGAAVFWWLARKPRTRQGLRVVGMLALAFDTLVVSSYVLIFSFEQGSPIRLALFVPVVEAALRYGLLGGLAMPVVLGPVYGGFELLRARRFDDQVELDFVTFPVGVQLIAGAIVGWLVSRLNEQTAFAESRAAEAERLRDALGRRVDLLEATNRCARALASSLRLDEAFDAFIRELRAVVPFDRTAIVLEDDGRTRVMAAAGVAKDELFPPGSILPMERSVLDEIRRHGQTVYRADMSEPRYVEEEELVAAGLRARVIAPIQVAGRPIGAVSVVRIEPHSFRAEEIELVSLLGRLAGTAVQNIRTYEAERTTADELRRLSALRADFVSLVSHELRSPMAAVIGSAQTLQQRWRQLAPDQREAFLAVIADETRRLAALIGDVLDTSRIEAGTFTYRFVDVDVAELVREAVGAAQLAQDEVPLRAEVEPGLPPVRADRDRLRQLIDNLISNAVKYSAAGQDVEVRAGQTNGQVCLRVTDSGPGISPEHQALIFEKFGRVTVTGGSKPGTGLGLFIARSIAEAHGGRLDVDSDVGRGTTFTLTLPLA